MLGWLAWHQWLGMISASRPNAKLKKKWGRQQVLYSDSLLERVSGHRLGFPCVRRFNLPVSALLLVCARRVKMAFVPSTDTGGGGVCTTWGAQPITIIPHAASTCLLPSTSKRLQHLQHDDHAT